MKLFRPAAPALCLLLALPAGAATPPAAGKTHTLFMGAEIAVERNKKFYRVEDISGSSFRIRIGQHDVLVPTRQAVAQLRIDHALKLGGTSVKLDKVMTERVYTSARDPRRQFEAEAGAMGGAGAAADLAAIEVQQAEMPFITPAVRDPRADQNYIRELQDNVDRSHRDLDTAHAQFRSDQNSAGAREDEMRDKLADGLFDAIEVAFEVSSPVPLEDPYLLVIARVREPGAKAGVARNWIYADKLEPLGAKPRLVRVREGGFPPGFALDDCQIRIYDRGREIPTNVSPKRVDLTREEARQYVVMEHLAAHRGKTLPPAPAFGQAPPDLRKHLAAGRYREAVFVRVREDGEPDGAFLNEACSRPLRDPYAEAIVAGTLFAPALDKGRPVTGVARLKLEDLR